MTETTDFVRYRGEGVNLSGEEARTPGEEGVYLADAELRDAVNAALAVGRPLLVTGEAGTGKTVLAESIAAELELGQVAKFVVRSDSRGRDLLYTFDNLRRFYDAQVQDPQARERGAYIEYGPLAEAIRSETQRVVLIDEIDKAPRDFPNDLLDVLDRMVLHVPELDLREEAKHRPIVVITSNRESQLPDPFLRRCVFHYIAFPSPERLGEILAQRLRGLELGDALRDRMVERFLELREIDGLEKKPATGELLMWARVLIGAGVSLETLQQELAQLPHLGALLKSHEDVLRVRRTRATG